MTDALTLFGKKKKSKRKQYLGNTPSKKSKTGREVRERMRKEGKVKKNADGEDIFLVDKDSDKWQKVDIPGTHMGHLTDAVKWWNKVGKWFGKKAKKVREWMLDSKNYEFENGKDNMSKGGKLKDRYEDPKK